MHITRVELANIKSYTSATFDFDKGATAITGENGAGKTTLIEAIAWTLFDVLDYKKEDFVRRGERRGSAAVTFESRLDEREYTVYRDTGTSYHVTDPRLGVRIAGKKEEVFRFLWQHLGLEPGTDLKSLFREAIGVPQGTFTAIFLGRPDVRKTAFDRLLKVEEYREAATKLLETTRFLDNSIRDVRETIARGEGELSRSEMVEAEHKEIGEMAADLGKGVELIETDLTRLRSTVSELNLKEQKVSSAKTSLDHLRAEREKADLIQRQAEQSLARADEAAKVIDWVKTDYERHLAAIRSLGELERQRNERDKLRAEIAKTDAATVNVRADRQRLDQEIAMATNLMHEIETLRPRVAEQESLEADIARIRDRIATAQGAETQISTRQQRRAELRESYRVNSLELQNAEEKALIAAELVTLESRSGELMKDLAGLQASLERDEKFQSEIQNGLCPILSQKCLNLRGGETLEDFVSSQFVELRSRIGVVETENRIVSDKLAVAREASKAAAAVDALRKRRSELAADGAALTAEIEALERGRADLADAGQKLVAAETALKDLDDPRGRIRLLGQQTARLNEMRDALGEAEKNLERLGSDRRIFEERLESFINLDERVEAATADRDATLEAYKLFVANDSEANALSNRKLELQTAKAANDDLFAKLTEAEKRFIALNEQYDPEQHNSMRASLLETERRHADAQARLLAARTRQQQLAVELEGFARVRKSLTTELREKERLETVAETTAFIRDTLKEAAPRVARNYVYHVSLEANQTFREITGNAEQTLKWAEDYSIVLEQDGYARPFVSLSGGEQMSAALAVRLALLKQLSDIRIAFFDEPTTNMDAERRENFAAQIRRITHFDQLFVISHDDTFEEYVDRTLHLGK